MKIKLALDDL